MNTRRPTVLLTGATGYIASHTWLALQAAGLRVIGLDDFSNSSPEVLVRRVESLLADLAAHAIDAAQLLPRCVLTTSDMLGQLSIEAAERAQQLLADTSNLLRERYNLK